MGLQFDSKRLETVELIRDGGVATVRFSTRVLYYETLTRLREIFDALCNDPAVETLFFEGDGKNFLLGADVDYFYEAVSQRRVDLVATYSDLGNDLFDAIENAPFTTIAKMDGAAMGGGFELALACSGRVATRGASMEFPETGLGIFPGWGGIKRSKKLVGSALAKWLVFTGKTISAPTARELRLVDVVVPREERDDAALKLAEAIRRSGAPDRSGSIPEFATKTAEFFSRPLREILSSAPCDVDEKRLLERLRRRAPVSLDFADRICDAVDLLSPTMERRFEDSLTWQIYQTSDAELGLERARRGNVAKISFTGKINEFYSFSPENVQKKHV